MTKLFLAIIILFLPIIAHSWGFFGHKLINEKAIFALPPGLIEFYKANKLFIIQHSVDPDLRKHSDEKEGCMHYIDIDHYSSSNPFDIMPKIWKDAVAKYSEDTLRKYGILPWAIQEKYYALVKAFKEKNNKNILRISSELGHYASDACVPLHTTENYDGQMTGQKGVHKLWETLIPEKHWNNYKIDFIIAQNINNPLKHIWKTIKKSYELSLIVLRDDKLIRQKFSQDKIHKIHSGKKNKTFSKEYIQAFNEKIGKSVELQMQESILFVSSLWYSAWIEAGQPKLAMK